MPLPLRLGDLQVAILRVLWDEGEATVARVTEAMVRHSRRAFSVLMVLGGEFGVRGRVGALPVNLSPSGITRTRVPTLNTRERVRLETALGA